MTRIPLPAYALAEALQRRGQSDFAQALTQALSGLPSNALPLIQTMQHGSMPVAGSIRPVIYRIEDRGNRIDVSLGLFFRSVEAGCACEGDPTVPTEHEECADLRLCINARTGCAWFDVPPEESP